MSRWSKTLLIGFVLCSCVGCDQVTKSVARETLRFAPTVTLLGDSVHLLYRENPGVAFNVGENLPEHLRLLFVVAGASVVLLVAGVYLFRRFGGSKGCLLGASLFVGGGLGNLVDRFRNDGRVIDFIMIDVGELRTAVFNVADVCILAGVALLLYYVRRSPENPFRT